MISRHAPSRDLVVFCRMFLRNRRHLLRVDPTAASQLAHSTNGGSDALYFMFWVHTRLRQSARYVGPTRHSHKKMARVTPCIFYFWFRQDSGRVPLTWNPRESPLNHGENDALYFMANFVPCFGICLFADLICLCFCNPAFASAFVPDIEAARGRVRGESDCKHFETALASEPLSENGCTYFCRELYLPLLLLLGRLLLLLLLLLRR